MPVAVYKIKKG
jgi:hypothetical protein